MPFLAAGITTEDSAKQPARTFLATTQDHARLKHYRQPRCRPTKESKERHPAALPFRDKTDRHQDGSQAVAEVKKDLSNSAVRTIQQEVGWPISRPIQRCQIAQAHPNQRAQADRQRLSHGMSARVQFSLSLPQNTWPVCASKSYDDQRRKFFTSGRSSANLQLPVVNQARLCNSPLSAH